MTPRIVAIAGSTRTESFNRRLLSVAVAGARAAGGEVEVIDLKTLKLPLFDQDDERDHGLPPGAIALKAAFNASHGLLLACPEYNSSISGVLKNAIDWASRTAPGESPLQSFRGKVAALVSASPGALGGLRSLVTVRSILGNIGVVVLPDQVAIPNAAQSFQGDELTDAARKPKVEQLARDLVTMATKLATR